MIESKADKKRDILSELIGFKTGRMSNFHPKKDKKRGGESRPLLRISAFVPFRNFGVWGHSGAKRAHYGARFKESAKGIAPRESRNSPLDAPPGDQAIEIGGLG